MPTTDDFDAESLASLILKTLNECRLDCSDILLQYCDGTSVMSGQKEITCPPQYLNRPPLVRLLWTGLSNKYLYILNILLFARNIVWEK